MALNQRTRENVVKCFKGIPENVLKEGWRDEDSVWGRMCLHIGKNNLKNRRYLYDVWRRNIFEIKSVISNTPERTCDDSFESSSFERIDTDIQFRKKRFKINTDNLNAHDRRYENLDMDVQFKNHCPAEYKIASDEQSTIDNVARNFSFNDISSGVDTVEWEQDVFNDCLNVDHEDATYEEKKDARIQESINDYDERLDESWDSFQDDSSSFGNNEEDDTNVTYEEKEDAWQQECSDEAYHEEKSDRLCDSVLEDCSSIGSNDSTSKAHADANIKQKSEEIDMVNDRPVEDEIEVSNQSTQSFKVTITNAELNAILPKENEAKGRLKPGWTDLFNEKTNQCTTSCALRFQYHHVRKRGSRKSRTSFINARARCIVEGCCKFSFKVIDQPDGNGNATMEIEVIGKQKHPKNENRKRQLRGTLRERVGEKVLREGVTNTYYTMIKESDISALQDGNISQCQSKDVLRKVASERRKSEKYHENIMIDICTTRDILNETEDVNSKTKGYIQYIAYHPFTVIMFTQEQLNILKESIAKQKAKLYLDATGSIIKKIEKQNAPYYYTLIVKSDKIGEPPLPIAEMVTTDHRTANVTHFLNLLRQHTSELTVHTKPQKIEIDFSWVFIHSTLLAFNHHDINHYLATCWNISNGKTEYKNHLTIIHICASHMIKSFINRIATITKDKGLKDFIVHWFALMQNTTSITSAIELWTNLSSALKTKSLTKEATESISILNSAIASKGEIVKEENTVCDHIDVTVEVDLASLEQQGPIRRRSPFYNAFEIPISIDGHHDNDYYCPEALRLIHAQYLPLFPLWSGIMLGDLGRHMYPEAHTMIGETRDTNAPVENWMKIIKKDIFQGRKHILPGKFIRTMHSNLKGRIKAHNMDLRPTKKQKKKNLQEGFDDAKEVWLARKQTSQHRQSKYFSSPTKVPTPKKRKKNGSQGKGNFKIKISVFVMIKCW